MQSAAVRDGRPPEPGRIKDLYTSLTDEPRGPGRINEFHVVM